MRRVLSFLVPALCLFALAGCGGSGATTGTSTPVAANNPAPTVGSVTPQSVIAGSAATTISVTGTGFLSSSALTFNGTTLKSTYVNATTLQAVVPADSLASGQEANVIVTNPTPGGGASPAAKFLVMAPTPAVSSLSPSVVPQGAAATITVTGSGFEANSMVLYNGSQRTTTFVNATTLQVTLTANDLVSYGTGQITVYNPGPGSSTTTPSQFVIAATTPTITSFYPTSITINASATVPQTITLAGSGFAPNATVQANGTNIPVTAQSTTNITATIAPSFFAAAGTIKVVVTNPGTPTIQSNIATINVVAPTLSLTISPTAVPAGSPDTKLTVTGNNFFQDSVVKWNDVSLATTFMNSRQLTAIIPASLISGFAQASIQVATPETADQVQPPPQPFTTYLALATNDIVYNSIDGLIYASIPSSVTGGLGNTISAIDPVAGTIVKSIFVGSEPTRIALSSDGKKMFVGLNGAGAVRQVDLVANTAGLQFGLGGGPGVYNPPYTAQDLAVLPGQPDSVAVYSNNGLVTVYDSGVARSKTSSGLNVYFNQNYGSLAFGSSASTLYLNSQSVGTYLYALTIDSTGVTSAKSLGSTQNSIYGNGSTMQYDNGRLYVTSGAIVDATSGTQVGQFSVPSSSSSVVTPAAGTVTSESAANRAWVYPNGYSYSISTTNQIVVYDETTFNPVGSIPVTGVNTSNYAPADMLRWGQNGLAFRTPTQLYVLQSPLVKDLSSSPADLSLTIDGASSAATGTPYSYSLKIANMGPNTATGVALTTYLPANVTSASFSSSQGSCTGSQVLYCDLGSISSGSSATVTITLTPTTAGTLSLAGYLDSVSFDPTSSNNQATASVTVTGNAYNASPIVTQLSPTMIQAGSSSPVLTVDGVGFTSGSSILWNGQPIPTTFVSGGQLTATLDSSLVSQLGWAQIAVNSPAPGGGQSAALPLHIYKLVNVPANAISYDAYSRKLYTVLPSTSTLIAGNSLVAVDPFTGNVGNPIQVGSEPNLLSETSDGQYLYIGLSGAKSVGQFNLRSQTMQATIPITVTTILSTTANVAATWMATMPGSNSTLALQVGGVGIFDITGSTGAFRGPPNTFWYGYQPAFADATHLYTYDSQSTGAEFYRYSIDANGLKYIDGTTLNGIGGFNGTFAVDRGLVFGGYGGIIDPTTTPPSQVALMNVYSDISGNLSGAAVPYQAQSKSFYVAGTSVANYLRRFDTQRFVLDQQIQLPLGTLGGWTGTRFGQDGLAYLVGGTSTTQPSQILLLRGPFVLPAEAASNSAPSLTSTSQSTITAGSGNVLITVTGSGLLAGATAIWNGVEHTTTWVDASHVQVAVPASELGTAQTVSLTVRNPGSGDSNALTVTIQ